MKSYVTLLVFLGVFLLSLPAFSQEEEKAPKTISRLGVDLRPSYAFPSYKDDILGKMLNTDGAKKSTAAASVHLKYDFSFTSATPEGRFYPGAWQGIGAGLFMFGNPKGLGNPVAIYLFQGAPVWHINPKLSLYYEWNFGLSMGWKACDGETAYSNLIVGSKMNAYINLGAGLKWDLGKGWDLTAGLDLTHFSNGNTSYPNPGVNMAGLRVGVTRTLGNHYNDNPLLRKYVDSPDTVSRSKRPGFELMLYGAWRKRVYRGGEDPVLLNGHFGIAGLSFAPMWEVSRIFRAGGALDLQWDESSNLRKNHFAGTTTETILFYRPSFFSQVSCGLSGRAELVMPLFSVNFGLGYNVIGPEESRASYQMANLKVRIAKGLFVNIGYQLLNFQRQDHLRLGLGYDFR